MEVRVLIQESYDVRVFIPYCLDCLSATVLIVLQRVAARLWKLGLKVLWRLLDSCVSLGSWHDGYWFALCGFVHMEDRIVS